MIRPAAPDDTDLLVWAKDTATEGFGRILRRPRFSDIAAADADWRRETRERIADPEQKLHHANWLVAAPDGQPSGAVLSFHDPAPAQPDDDTPDALRPIMSLLPWLPGSLYVDSIAVRPEARGNGLARALMLAAEDRARRLGLDRMTLIALSSNSAARPLYFDLGFRDADEARLVPGEWAPAADRAFLMEKTLDSATS